MQSETLLDRRAEIAYDLTRRVSWPEWSELSEFHKDQWRLKMKEKADAIQS